MKIILLAAEGNIVNKRLVKAFTLMEVMVAIIVIAILVSIALPFYRKAVERTKNKEAKTSLGIVSASEQTLYYETGNYADCSSTSDCNTKLKLSLSGKDWKYSVTSNTSGFTVAAQRQPNGRIWTLSFDGNTETLNCSGSSAYCE